MTEDLHNDIDDLFRSGLEGKEDMPSPGVWSAIEKALPPAPSPLPPTSATPPTTGGWTSTMLFKGLIGAAVVAIIGTAAYIITSNNNEANAPTNDRPKTEYSNIEAPLNTDGAVKGPQLQSTKADGSDETKSIDAEDELESTIIPEAEKKALPPVNQKNQTTRISPEPGRSTENPALKSEDRRESGISGSTIENPSVSSSVIAATTGKAANATRTPKAGDVVPGTKQSGKAILQSGLTAANIQADTRIAEPKAARTTALIDRKEKVNQSSISTPAILPYSSSQFPGGVAAAGSKGQSGSSTLKRNNWKSRIYLVPLISLNMTNMDVEENRAYGPRIGREHIEFKETEQTKSTVSPGIMAGFAIHPRISVQTGISEFKNNISVSPKQIRAVRDLDGKVRYRMDCSSGSYFLEPRSGSTPSVGDSLRIASSEIRMRYVTVPLSVRVNFGNDNVKIFATAGTDINILAGKQTSTSLSPASSEKINPVRTEGTRKQYLNGTIGAGVEIKAGKRLGILLMPQYRFPMGNMNEDGPVLTYPKTFSVTSGVRIGF
jgi:Outer membrane protein beta-barrel domain